MRVSKILVHGNFSGTMNDIALLQLGMKSSVFIHMAIDN